jgi:hypothetical protein
MSTPIVILTSATSVTVDGTNYGKPADAIANNLALAPLIQAAIETYIATQAALVVTANADKQAAIDAKTHAETKLALLISGAEAAMSFPTSEECLAAGQALLAQARSLQMDDQKAALLKQQADIAAKLAALQ